MVRILDTIIECDVSDDERLCNTIKSEALSPCEALNVLPKISLGKVIESCSFGNQIQKGLELSEPEGELDPVSAETLSRGSDITTKDVPVLVLKPEQSKKSRKNRHASLIDKAFKLQKKQQLQDPHSGATQQDEPVYIWLSDLAADWSSYMPKTSLEPVLHSISLQDTNIQSTPSQLASAARQLPTCNVKRNRKKSLIDKALLQTRKELVEQLESVGARLSIWL